MELGGWDLPACGIRGGWAQAAHGIDAGFTADAAAGTEEGLAFEQDGGGLDVFFEFDAHEVFAQTGLELGAMADGADVFEALDDSLSEKEAEDEFQIVAWGAHGDGQLALDAFRGGAESEVDGEGFLGGEEIFLSSCGEGVDSENVLDGDGRFGHRRDFLGSRGAVSGRAEWELGLEAALGGLWR